ncbi:HAD family hydrolase [Oceanobacillus caeni]|uniref:HAD family hydrolase n=1 Tax=Bacillaceae TaxID=186817 RepID=UPI0006228A57|nr:MULTISPECIES: HAD family hydrolase [Bacillaceae]KKE78798.1 HAD family hydrolase [Bacilli bacterium VT-13-104]PZD84634.1 HAD family hydrolase [Bacilli bacterium]MCR1834774.1 HAD family hydrolase [Oceanobacillus caeni]MED4476316.1 HAD family hydrolase [Oceanobacillus caeni]PZD89206.1 HAD family hydrolase [Bacilli bacterium]
MIKAVIFDFDGLIVDTETAWYDAFKETMELYHVELPLEQFVKGIGSDDIALFQYFKEQLGERYNPEEIQSKADRIHKDKMTSPHTREGVRDYLEEARKLNYKIALASSSPKDWVTHYLKELQLLHYFDELITRDDVENVKPEPDLYLKAIEALNISPKEAVAFEDSLNGLKAALTAGLKCVIVPNPVTDALPFENHHLRLTSMAEMSLYRVIQLIDKD